jgi:hypothetical protein
VGLRLRSGPALVGKFDFDNPFVGKPVDLRAVCCSGVLIAGSVLDLFVALSDALREVPLDVGSVFTLTNLSPG